MKWYQWMALVCIVWTGLCTVCAKTVVWNETFSSGTFRVGGTGWLDLDGNAAVFEEGDSVILSNCLKHAKLTLSGKFRVGDFIVNATNNWEISGSGDITNMTSFSKIGPGDLTLGSNLSFTNDLHFLRGYAVNWSCVLADNGARSPFGNMQVPRKIVIGSGNQEVIPTVHLCFYDGITYGTTPPWMKPGVAFEINAGKLKTGYTGASSTLGDVTFRNGGILLSSGRYFVLNGHVACLRDEDGNRYTAGISDNVLSLGTATGEPIEFYVEEVTSEDGTDDGIGDFAINSKIVDYDPLQIHERYRFSELGFVRSSWRKTGPGTLLFPGGPQCPAKIDGGKFGTSAETSTYTGDVFIDEGVVRVCGNFSWTCRESTALGKVHNLDRERTIYVNEGTRLEYGPDRGAGFGVMTYTEYPPIEITTVVSNAVLYTSTTAQIGSLKLYGTADFDYNYRFVLGALFHLERDEPYTFRSVSGNNYLAHLTDMVILPPPEGSTEKEKRVGFTEFRICEARENTAHAPDCVIDCVFANPACHQQYTPYQCTFRAGIKKTGEGVLLVNRNQVYSNTNIVAQGGMYLAGSVTTNVLVKAGAAFGGSGTVKGNLLLEEGSGLVVDAANPSAQLTVNCNVEMPEEGLLMVYGYEGDLETIEDTVFGIPLPTAGGSCSVGGETIADFENVSFEGWRVRVKGYTQRECRNLRVRKETVVVGEETQTTLSVYPARIGTSLILR